MQYLHGRFDVGGLLQDPFHDNRMDFAGPRLGASRPVKEQCAANCQTPLVDPIQSAQLSRDAERQVSDSVLWTAGLDRAHQAVGQPQRQGGIFICRMDQSVDRIPAGRHGKLGAARYVAGIDAQIVSQDFLDRCPDSVGDPLEFFQLLLTEMQLWVSESCRHFRKLLRSLPEQACIGLHDRPDLGRLNATVLQSHLIRRSGQMQDLGTARMRRPRGQRSGFRWFRR